MSIITMSQSLIVGDWRWGQKRFDLSEMSDSTGNTKTRLLGPPRWIVSMAAPSQGLVLANASLWETMILQLRGGQNHLALYDLLRPTPQGDCRGTMTLNATASAGATSAVIAVTGQSGKILKAGDWLQIGTGLTSQLVKLMADATAGASTISVTFEPPLRAQQTGGTAVAWDHPLAHFKMLSDSPQWAARAGWNTQTGYALDMIEQWT